MIGRHNYSNPTFLRSPCTRSTCANCGGQGHNYKTCGHPIISFGIICYTLCVDATHTVCPRYLMVQRKDSMSYVEFVRGKYDLNNLEYLVKMFCNMTSNEKAGILCTAFDKIWNDMWCKAPGSAGNENSHSYNREYKDASEKFRKLTHGHILGDIAVDLHLIVQSATESLGETEWGFPKGRRNINEQDHTCAIREFCEETGLCDGDISLAREIRPLEEIFIGSNKVRYKHIYYAARFQQLSSPQETMFDPLNKVQSKEIKDVQWLSYAECQAKISECNKERKTLLACLDRSLHEDWGPRLYITPDSKHTPT